VAGSAAFIALVTAKANASALESEVFGWYTQSFAFEIEPLACE